MIVEIIDMSLIGICVGMLIPIFWSEFVLLKKFKEAQKYDQV